MAHTVSARTDTRHDHHLRHTTRQPHARPHVFGSTLAASAARAVGTYAALVDEEGSLCWPMYKDGTIAVTKCLGRMGRAIYPFDKKNEASDIANYDLYKSAVEQELWDITLNRSKWVMIEHDGQEHYTAWLPGPEAPPETTCDGAELKHSTTMCALTVHLSRSQGSDS